MATPDLADAALLAAVADAGGFRAAAERRGASASSISDAVRRLEEACGVRLLNRTTRSVTPTEAGARLLARLRPALAEIEDAFDALGGDEETPTGTLRLNVPTIVARRVLPPIATEFLRRHPGVRMEVVAEDSFVDVLAAGFDAGVRYEERVELDMIAIPIGPRRQRFAAAAAPSYLEARGRPEHPRDVAAHARIGHRFARSGLLPAWEFARGAEVVKVPVEGPLVASALELEIAAAVAGLGLIYTFEDALSDEIAKGALVPVLEEWWLSFTGPLLYYQSRRHMPSPLRAFVDFVKGL
ncbi:LysR family transcriptional regulator [Hansschlegelia zhihuaiae]|uniref:LysR family transcriptional regulator n=1 Tax=Hansschlegelia zhihuaiae TaxID=405005 RepID=A0A4Q0M7J0_9HYPH|nr:LysR family transcriptional regulator [Hansschlegelia zhihuaiae]RXF68759.1 LysR family transcriptional regulator [Hansschlegelia zhihuaiae]